MRPPFYGDKGLIVFAGVVWVFAAALLIPLTYFGFWLTTPGSSEFLSTTYPPTAPFREPLEPFSEIAPGARPSAIEGANLYLASAFMDADVPVGFNVSVEGIVERSGYNMGAPFICIKSPTSDITLYCEGGNFEPSQFSVGSNYVIRGRVFYKNMLSGTKNVTQQQINDALRQERL